MAKSILLRMKWTKLEAIKPFIPYEKNTVKL